jgi:hypothetical protein
MNPLTPEEMQVLASALGTTVPEAELPYITKAVSVVLRTIGQLKTAELHDIEPTFSYRVPN